MSAGGVGFENFALERLRRSFYIGMCGKGCLLSGPMSTISNEAGCQSSKPSK
ncbi:hypothetical protein HCDG_03376 [Histoplasma capsulatum H143]|uniref:Uncharacterized protein n=1 Tax=Ajellomyces capsulatus (strain H143) TaxID=544712 RepID=C6HBH7_AJECH|nr:hypothetical protein HCDG_03376 [Histoplasma capsulatum H143]